RLHSLVLEVDRRPEPYGVAQAAVVGNHCFFAPSDCRRGGGLRITRRGVSGGRGICPARRLATRPLGKELFALCRQHLSPHKAPVRGSSSRNAHGNPPEVCSTGPPDLRQRSDTEHGPRDLLEASFATVEIDVIGSVAVFTARTSTSRWH